MKASSGTQAALTCHPATPCRAVSSIGLEILPTAGSTLTLRYVLDGDVGRLLIPAHTQPGRADALWQHTCFELFCTAGATAAYYELNFSPSTQWAIYGFTAYRQGMVSVQTRQAPRIAMHQHAGGLELEAIVDLEPLTALQGFPVVRVAASAVVEEANSGLSYWALAHPAAKPDFHHADAFVLSVARSEG